MTSIRRHLRAAAFGLAALAAPAAAQDAAPITDSAVWDGAPPIGGAWIAHGDVQAARDVVVSGPEGREVRARLLPLSPEASRPGFVVSADVARALGLSAGAPAELSVRAPTPEDDPILARVAAAMAELAGSGGAEPPSGAQAPESAAAPEAPVGGRSAEAAANTADRSGAEAPGSASPEPAAPPSASPAPRPSASPEAAAVAPARPPEGTAPAQRPVSPSESPPSRPGAGPAVAEAPAARSPSALPAPRPAAAALAPSASPEPRPRPQDRPARPPEAA